MTCIMKTCEKCGEYGYDFEYEPEENKIYCRKCWKELGNDKTN